MIDSHPPFSDPPPEVATLRDIMVCGNLVRDPLTLVFVRADETRLSDFLRRARWDSSAYEVQTSVEIMDVLLAE